MAHQPKYTLSKQVIIIDDAREMEVPKSSCTLSVSSSFLCHKKSIPCKSLEGWSNISWCGKTKKYDITNNKFSFNPTRLYHTFCMGHFVCLETLYLKES